MCEWKSRWACAVVLTSQEDKSDRLPDSDLLDRAQLLGRVLFSQDKDLLREANRRQRAGIDFAGVVYAHQQEITIGQSVNDLHLLAQVFDPIDMLNRVEHLPLS